MAKIIDFLYKYKLVLFVILLLLTNALTALFFYQNTNPKKILEKYNLVSPSFTFIDKNDLIVNFQPLRDYLQKTYEKKNDNYTVSIYFEYLNTGANITVNKDEKMWPASLIKIPVAMAVMKKVEDGIWKLSNQLVILDEDKDNEFGDLYKQTTGTTYTIEEFIKYSIINSDNTAHSVLLRNLENGEIEELYNHLGLDSVIQAVRSGSINDTDNRITAKNYSIFFRSLYTSSYLNPDNSQYFLNLLSTSGKKYLYKNNDIKFSHKFGFRDDLDVFADSGLVYVDNRPYILTVMVQRKSKSFNDESIQNIFNDISNKVYDYVKNAK